MNYHVRTFFFFKAPITRGKHRALYMLVKGFINELLCPNPLCTLAAQPKLVQPAHLGRGPPLLAPPIISGRTPHRPSIFSGPAPARLLPQVPKPMRAARGRCTSACTSSGPSHRTQLLAPDSNGEARRSHYGKSEAGTRALPGFGAAAARGCA